MSEFAAKTVSGVRGRKFVLRGGTDAGRAIFDMMFAVGSVTFVDAPPTLPPATAAITAVDIDAERVRNFSTTGASQVLRFLNLAASATFSSSSRLVRAS